jgi:2-keto-4-pentenoate hydratase/2-oxohepta-3-ene-1,7-dioic acid hydratase in catechol pathway
MKLVKFERRGLCAAGVLEDTEIAVIGSWHAMPAHLAPFELPSMSVRDLVARARDAKERVQLTEVTLLPPVSPAARVICVGANYRDHAEEIGLPTDGPPLTFLRHPGSLVGHGEALFRPQASNQFDYEGELAVVIGHEGRHIAERDALSHVLGYTCFMDGSLRDFQKIAITPGKNFWRSGAMGPWIQTAKIALPTTARLQTWVNGQKVQATTLDAMIHRVEALIAHCSMWTPLAVGDVIATGTPSGVAARRNPPLWLKDGDQVEVRIDGVGGLRNPVVDEA